MTLDKQFTKYQQRGAYHWQNIKKISFFYNAYVVVRYQQVVDNIPRNQNLKICNS